MLADPPRFMGHVCANTTLVASTVSSVGISIMICPGTQPRMATVTPAGVSEILTPVAPELCGLVVAWVDPRAGWSSL